MKTVSMKHKCKKVLISLDPGEKVRTFGVADRNRQDPLAALRLVGLVGEREVEQPADRRSRFQPFSVGTRCGYPGSAQRQFGCQFTR